MDRLPPSGEFASPEAVIDRLETLCAEAESALRASAWRDLDGVLAEQRRLTHLIEHAFAGVPRDGARWQAARSRLRRIHAVREGQLRRLMRHRAALGERLTAIARWRRAAKSLGAGERLGGRLGSLDAAR